MFARASPPSPPPGWTNQQILDLDLEQFAQLSEEDRVLLRSSTRRDPYSPVYRKVNDLDVALQTRNQRPPTPPSFIPPGWTEAQASAALPDFALLDKLSPDDSRLWAAGTVADSAIQAKKNGTLPSSPPAFVPAGWTTEQAICPTFDVLSALSYDDLTRFMQSQAQAATAAATAAATTTATDSNDSISQSNPSPLVQILQRADFPPWGYVIVRTDYSSEARWEKFTQRVLGEMCDAQLDEETGDPADVQRMKDTLEFKLIEDPRLEAVDDDEVRKHFRSMQDQGGIAAGLGLSICLVADKGAVDSAADGSEMPYLVAVDVTEEVVEMGEYGYPGRFKVAAESVLSGLYPKLEMVVSPGSLWAVIDEEGAVWNGDE
ncbi:hypothetical protein B0T17DRAFT_222206 [Bombardia bombarda]|uniref:DUF6924 domain-containing protein n=1 Tax=Bombardia bombarda TaxID=252184 RepID=A0AA39XB60_9PEZI|nr:hypothetical protein B0T17DRAFT_222206 [Bombardia bombarda]